VNEIVIYGATGYIGALTARIAVERGLRPVLAGRRPGPLAALRDGLRDGRTREDGRGEALRDGPRDGLDLPVRVARLDRPAELDALLGDASAVLNAAGPFGATQQPLLDACVRTRTHYLDLAGEYPEFLAVAARDEELVSAGVQAMPGAGFGVVPTDAVAVHLARRLPSATRLELSFVTAGGLSRGTLDTLLSGMPTLGAQRQQDRLVPTRAASERRRVPVGERSRRRSEQRPEQRPERQALVVTNPWRADVVSAATSTGVPTISTFLAVPAPIRLAMRLGPVWPWLFTGGPSRRLRAALLRRIPAGPTPGQLAAGASLVHGVALDDAGGRAEAVLTGPEPYLYTAHTAAELLTRTARGEVVPGYRTPAQVHGPEVALTAPGVTLRDLDREVTA
jgi:short subunit dehydrogenase-like uncharacterized protein